MARPFYNIKPKIYRLGPDRKTAIAEILFIHGAFAGAWCFHDLAKACADKGYGANILELPGHGLNAWPLPWLTSLNDYADIARRAAGSLGRPILVGHSMGGWIAQKILEVIDLPCVLLAPLLGSGLSWASLLGLLKTYPLKTFGFLRKRHVSELEPKLVRQIFLHDTPLQKVSAMMELFVPEPLTVTLEMAFGLTKAKPVSGKAPRLVVAAEIDPFLPLPKAQFLARDLGAGLSVLPKFSHGLFMHDPKGKVRDILFEFLWKIQSSEAKTHN